MLDWFRDLAMSTIVAPKLTYKDLQAMPNDGKRYELIDGEVYITPSPSWRHQEILGNIYIALRTFVEERDLGKVSLAPLDVVFDQRNALQPDLLFVRKDRLNVIQHGHIEGPPDLVIEVLSPSTASYDRDTKIQVYARSGVSEIWFVDPESRTVDVLNLGADGRFILTAHLSGDGAIAAAVLPGLPLSLRQVFAS